MRRPLPKNFDPNIMTPIRGNNPPRIQISPPGPLRGRGGVADRISPPSRFDPFGFEMQIPTLPVAPPVPQPDLPEGIDPGGQYFTDPVTGNQMYQPPMPSAPPGMMISQVMPPSIDLTTGQPRDTRLPIQQPMIPPQPI